MKKIGIFTLNGNFNYGNRFQNYATQVFLERLGYEVETVQYRRDFSKDKVNNNILKKIYSHSVNGDVLDIIKNKLVKIFNEKSNRIKNQLLEQRVENFRNFSERYINETKDIIDQTILEDKEKQVYLNSNYSTFFVGSDQVWNLDNGKFSTVFFLPFVDKLKRNSFSASFGISNIPSLFENDYRKGLNGMNNISVREESGIEIVQELTNRESTLMLDPTFLLGKDNWLEIADCNKTIKNKKYILTYFLGKKTKEYQRIIDEFVKNVDLEVISLNDVDYPENFIIAPDKFLGLIQDAEFILTDSFHGVAFSIIFRKPFMAVDRIDANVNMNTRIISVLKQFNLSNRYFKLDREILTKEWLEIDYSGAEIIINNNREIAQTFINKSLEAISENDEE